jgi:hypothetical protein
VSGHDALKKRLARLSSVTDLKKKVNRLRKFGPRETGSPGHARFIAQIAKEIASLGLPVHRDSHRFNRWSRSGGNSGCALEVGNQDGNKQSVRVASAYPYSGLTGPDGVAGPLELASCVPWKMDGKIVVFDVPCPRVPVKLLVGDLGHLLAGATDFPKTISHPVLASTVFGPDLAAAKAAGAIGVVAVWRKEELTAAQAAGQYVPFTFPYRDIPAVWVAGDEGEDLLKSARQGAHATLKLDATLSPGTVTDTVWTVVEGEVSSESILVVTHTDGGNAVEENGAIGVLELVRMFAKEPRPKRTLVFVFVTGHLRIPAVTAHGQATTAWLTAHPEWWSGKNGAPRAVAGLVIEHLGALCQPNDTTKLAVELTYATNTVMQRILEESWAERKIINESRAKRKNCRVLIAQPSCLIHIGEGEPLYQQRIPAIALASVPKYLLATTNSDVVDIEVMREQIAAFAHALQRLEETPARELGRAKRVGLVPTIRTLFQVVMFFVRNGTLLSHLLSAICFKISSLAISIAARSRRWLKDFVGDDETKVERKERLLAR